MIKLEISLTGAGPDELRQLEALMQKILVTLKPQMKGIEATIAAVPVVDPYESTKKKILEHIRWRKIETSDRLSKQCMFGASQRETLARNPGSYQKADAPVDRPG